MIGLDWSQCSAVESEEVMEPFDVTREQIRAVLDFVAQSLKAPAPPAQESAPVGTERLGAWPMRFRGTP